MKWIDEQGRGHTLLVLTDAESRLIRRYLAETGGDFVDEVRVAWKAGIQRATERMAKQSKDEWKASAAATAAMAEPFTAQRAQKERKK